MAKEKVREATEEEKMMKEEKQQWEKVKEPMAQDKQEVSQEFKILFSALDHANKKGCYSLEEATVIFQTLQKFK